MASDTGHSWHRVVSHLGTVFALVELVGNGGGLRASEALPRDAATVD